MKAELSVQCWQTILQNLGMRLSRYINRPPDGKSFSYKLHMPTVVLT